MTEHAERFDSAGCFGCRDTVGYRVRHDAYYVDTRTNRAFCAECVGVLAGWELDGCPDPDGDSPYWTWIDAETVERVFTKA